MRGKQDATLERRIAAAEKEVVKAKATVARLRRRRPRLDIEDYDLHGPGGEKVPLSSLFGDKDDLILIHNMGRGCPFCTMWADGFNGLLPHIENRAAFVVVSPDSPAEQAKFAASRGWNFRMLSARGTAFTRDLGFESRDGGYQPGVSILHREKDGRIVRAAKGRFGPGDDFCSAWHFFDMLANGRAGWAPRFRY